MQLLALELRALFFRLDSVNFLSKQFQQKKFFSCASDQSFFTKVRLQKMFQLLTKVFMIIIALMKLC